MARVRKITKVPPHTAFDLQDVPQRLISQEGDPKGIVKKALLGLTNSEGVRKLTFQVTDLLGQWDPFSLISTGGPKTEYRYEAIMMSTLALNDRLTYENMRAIWRYSFANPTLFDGEGENPDLLSLIKDIQSLI